VCDSILIQFRIYRDLIQETRDLVENCDIRRWSQNSLFQTSPTQLAKFVGPTAGFHRQFRRPAGGSRWGADIGGAHRLEGGPMSANDRLPPAGRRNCRWKPAVGPSTNRPI